MVEYLTTIAESGFTLSKNSVNNAETPLKGAILAEPFPWTVGQAVVPVLGSDFSKRKYRLDG